MGNFKLGNECVQFETTIGKTKGGFKGDNPFKKNQAKAALLGGKELPSQVTDFRGLQRLIENQV